MARRLAVVLPLAAAVLLLATAATAQSGPRPQPKEDKPKGPPESPPKAQGPPVTPPKAQGPPESPPQSPPKAQGPPETPPKVQGPPETPPQSPPKAQGPPETPPKAQGPPESSPQSPPKAQGPPETPPNTHAPPESPPQSPPKAQGPPETPPNTQAPPESPPQSPPKAQGPPESPPKAQSPPESPPTAQGPPESPLKAQGPKPKPKPMSVKCTDSRKENPYCFNRNMDCPSYCPQSCYADCNTCKPVCVCNTPGACGDPRFIGGDGNAFYFHGRRDADFCVVSDRDLHINAHFIGKSGHSGMSRDFTWIQAIAILFDGGHRLYVGARKTGTWDDAVEHLEITLDGEPVHLPADDADKWMSSRVPKLSVTRTKAANGVLITLDGMFSVRANAVPITEEDSRVHRYGVTADDCLSHLELAFKFDALTEDVHGVVGQTYRSDYVNRFDVRAAMPTMGGDASFATSSLFAADCRVACYGVARGNDEGSSVMSELSAVTCARGMDGQGVICTK